jgi:HAD superfamily hydrolase (TIGR01490 family)
VNSSSKIGAFFDLDGTLVAPPSLEWQFIGYLLGRDALGGKEIGRWLARCAKDCLRDPRSATIGNKQYLAGLRESLTADWANSLAPGSPQFLPAGIERMARHFAQGHRVFLISGTLNPLAQVVARRLPGPVEICATELEVSGRYWTGRIAGEHMSGDVKARAIRSLAARFGLALWDSYAYGNSISDLPMLDSVGHRVAINPPARLRRIARREGWQSCDWPNPTEGPAKDARVRTRQLSPKEAR